MKTCHTDRESHVKKPRNNRLFANTELTGCLILDEIDCIERDAGQWALREAAAPLIFQQRATAVNAAWRPTSRDTCQAAPLQSSPARGSASQRGKHILFCSRQYRAPLRLAVPHPHPPNPLTLWGSGTMMRRHFGSPGPLGAEYEQQEQESQRSGSPGHTLVLKHQRQRRVI